MVIVETSLFTKQVQKILSNEEYRQLQIDLVNRPNSGSIIPGSGGLRKVRWGYGEKGKQGGVRTIYYWAVSQEILLMLFIYPKNVKDNLSPIQLRALRQIVKDEFP
jgi:mRNA-degrading endonuclease RelE of RelBE toxin-antitoxin system